MLDIDTISHSDALHNKQLKSLNLKGLCKYDSLHRAYMFAQSNTPANCSHILIFFKVLACYAIYPHTHQWYRINAHKIMENHIIALCNDKQVHMLWLPSAGLGETNAFETIARLITTNNHTNTDQANNNTSSNPPPNSIPDNQSNIILQQLSRLTKELKIFTTHVSRNITEMTQAQKLLMKTQAK